MVLYFVIRLQKLIQYNILELFLSSNIASILFSEVFFSISGAYRENKEKKDEKAAAKALLSDKLSFILFKTSSVKWSKLRCLAFLYQ